MDLAVAFAVLAATGLSDGLSDALALCRCVAIAMTMTVIMMIVRLTALFEPYGFFRFLKRIGRKLMIVAAIPMEIAPPQSMSIMPLSGAMMMNGRRMLRMMAVMSPKSVGLFGFAGCGVVVVTACAGALAVPTDPLPFILPRMYAMAA